MPLTVRRLSVIEQTTELLQNAIAGGRWKTWLPGERDMSRQLGISRTSYRVALQSLAAAGWIDQVQGKGTRVRRRPARWSAQTPVEIGLILPRMLGQLRPSVSVWIDELRARLAAEGHTLALFHGDRFYARHPGPTLRTLTREHPAACWILVMSTLPAQQWFADHGVPCVVAGTVHGATPLPYVNVDFRAVCRHAAGVLLSAGHRRLVLLNRRLPGPDSNQRGAGDREGEAGFLEAISLASQARGSVIYHDYSSDGVARALRQAVGGSAPATGIVITDPHCYLAAISYLAERRLRVPQDVSLISRDHDTFLEFLRPIPARYQLNPETYAHRVLTQVRQTGRRQASAAVIFPTFVPGKSVGPPPALPSVR